MADVARREALAWSLYPASGYLLLLFWQRPVVHLFGMATFPADWLFVLAALALVRDLAVGAARIPPRPAWIAMVAFGATLLLSAALAAPLPTGRVVGYLYLFALAVCMAAVARGENMRVLVRAWLIGAALCVLVALIGLAAWAVDPASEVYAALSYGPGSLAIGAFPRIAGSFEWANVAANYAAPSALLAIYAGREGWITRWLATGLVVGCTAVVLLALSAGLSGLAAALGWWAWASAPRDPRRTALFVAGLAISLLVLASAILTPTARPGIEPLVTLPGGISLWPAIRVSVWQNALQAIGSAPWTGHGLGSTGFAVRWITPAGQEEVLTDAHNSFLSVAAQAGLPALLAFLELVAVAARPLMRRRVLDRDRAGAALLAVAFVQGMAIQGLTGSFEDARHLWALLGLLLALPNERGRAPDGTAASRR